MPNSKENILLVEGHVDKNFIQAFLEHKKIDVRMEIIPCGNDSGCIEQFCDYLNNANKYGCIGMIVDADESCQKRYEQIQSYLDEHLIRELKLPELPSKGLVDQYNGSKVGIWIMPNCKGIGSLENFLYNKISKDNSLLNEVEKAIESLVKKAEKDTALKVKIFNTKTHKKKAVVHTYMAWKEPPDLSYGTALKANFFTQQSSEEKEFEKWLKEMYSSLK